MKEEAPDWGGDDDEEDDREEEPTKPFNAATLTDTAMAEMICLLEEQRLHRQSQLAHAQEDALRASFKDEALAALMSPTPLAILDLLQEASPPAVLEVRDREGMTLLHHAVRIGRWEIVDRCLELCPPLVDQVTSPTDRPAHWTALMVAVDVGRGLADEGTLHYILKSLLREASLATLEVRAANGTTVLHMSCAKGMMKVTKRLLYGIYLDGPGGY